MPDLDLTAEQRRVIDSSPNGPHLLVIAAPGSGKTRVIAARIDALLQSGAAPDQTLALTFTQRAAGELRQRLAADVWAGTFHAYCADLLEIPGAPVGVSRPLRVFDESRQREALIAAIAEAGIAFAADERTQQRPVRDVKNAIGARKRGAAWQPTPQFRSELPDQSLDQIADAYGRLLAIQDALDYDDLILRATQLLHEDPATAESVHHRIRFMFVDECHDVSAEQYRLIQLLPPRAANRQLMAVADPDQSIFGWRGAHATETLARFRRDSRPALHPLTRNHRSTPEIVAAADAVMADNRGTRQSAAAASGCGFRVACLAFDDVDAEADAVARLIARARAEGDYACGDIAILYRSHARAERVEAALIERGIPVWRVQPGRFYDQPEVQERLRYLDLALALHDDQLASALNWPRVLVDECTMTRLRRLARAEGLSLCALAGRIDAYADRVGPLTRAAVRELMRAIEHRLAASLDRPIAEVIEALLAMLQQRRDAIPREERETLHGVLAFLGAPLAEHAARLAALPTGQTIALRPAADDADAAAAAVILRHALGRCLGRPVLLQRPDDPRDPSSFTIDLGAGCPPSASGFGLGVRRTREFGYSLSTQALRLGQMLLIGAESGRAQPFVVFDLETGDRHPNRAEAIEVAALRVAGEAPPFHRLVRPSGPRALTPGATEVHGLAWRDVRDAPPASAVLPDLLSFFGDATLVGHNIEAFDYPVLRRVAREHGLAPPLHDLIDTCKMARRLLPAEPSHRLEDLGQRFGIVEPQQHRRR